MTPLDSEVTLPMSQKRDMGHPDSEKGGKADSSASLRNDNKRGLRNDNKESSEGLQDGGDDGGGEVAGDALDGGGVFLDELGEVLGGLILLTEG